jgi:Zn-dependent protease
MQDDLARGAIWYGVFLFSTVCHEAAHAWSASRMGDNTAAAGGQASMNPWPHIRREPVGMVLVPLLCWFAGGWIIGWASAPYDPAWARRFPRRAALMALAGPLANLALAAGALTLIRLGYEWGQFGAPYSVNPSRLAVSASPGAMDTAALVLSVTASLNLLLCVFNLAPLPPLDGSNVPLLLLPEGAADRYAAAMRHPMLRYAGILLASRLIPPILPRLLAVCAGLVYGHNWTN